MRLHSDVSTSAAAHTDGPGETCDFRPTDNTWMRHAACAGADPELWFPDPSDTAKTEQALAICRRCPIQEQCLAVDLARKTQDRWGVWGGQTQQKRRGDAPAITHNRSSAYLGVSKIGGRWRANICHDMKTEYLGCFGTEIEAARAHDRAARRLHGRQAKTNFPAPEDTEDAA